MQVSVEIHTKDCCHFESPFKIRATESLWQLLRLLIRQVSNKPEKFILILSTDLAVPAVLASMAGLAAIWSS
jgi:hypothetical protein